MTKEATAIIVITGDAPNVRVGGLSITERWKRSLSAHGITRIMPMPLTEVATALKAADAPIVVVWDHSVAEHLAIESFLEEANQCPDNTLRSLLRDGHDAMAPVVVLGKDVAVAAASLSLETLRSPSKLTSGLFRADVVHEPITITEGYWAHIGDEEAAKLATWRLLNRLRWRPGGLVAKHLNRPISTRISYLLIDTPVTPNQTTIFAFLVGLVGVVLIFLGGYVNVVVGTALLQINSIVDGIDGELARVRHQNSEFGAYLDSVCDEILNSATMIGIGYYLSHFKYGGQPLYLWAGCVAGIANFAYALVHWHCKWKHGLGFYWWFEAYKPRRQVHRSTSAWSYLKKLTMKESYFFLFMVGAILEPFAPLLEIVLWPFAIGGFVLTVLFTIHIPIKRARW
jgi:phosphatidylglycerophosphate synthase